jgi:hypothetical protein
MRRHSTGACSRSNEACRGDIYNSPNHSVLGVAPIITKRPHTSNVSSLLLQLFLMVIDSSHSVP